MIEILETGPLASIQDLGRVGHASWGIGAGGAADRGSLRLANRLVGNDEGAAAVEVLLGGARLQFDEAALIGVTGAPTPVVIDGRPGRNGGPQPVPAGAVVSLLAPRQRLRTYLAVRGGLATPSILGSRSVDESSGLGRALRAGDRVPIGREIAGPPLVDLAPQPAWPVRPVELHALLGPRDDWFTPSSLERLSRGPYVVDAASDRVGLRLSGAALERCNDDELLSEPALRGAIEVPGDGQPIVFGAGHPTTCGYPVVAVLEPTSSDLAAQCRPGQLITFTLARPRIRLATRTPDSTRGHPG